MVKAGKHDKLSPRRVVNNGVGEFAGNDMPEFSFDARKRKRHTKRPRDGYINCTSEFKTKARRALLVPSLSLQKLLLSLWPEYQLHQG